MLESPSKTAEFARFASAYPSGDIPPDVIDHALALLIDLIGERAGPLLARVRDLPQATDHGALFCAQP